MGLFSRQEPGTEPRMQSRSPAGKRAGRASIHDSGEPLDPADTHKRRARRRLIGATALVLGIIVFLPMVFDPSPKPLADDIVVQIPDKESAFNPVVPGRTVPPPPAKSLTTPPADAAPAGASAPTKAAEAPARPSVPAPAPAAAPEAARALAALEGKSEKGAANAPPPAQSSAGAYAVQIGAFASAEKVKDLRGKLTTAGLSSYTETIKTPSGDRTRVRLGPYPSKEAADKAREILKKRLVLDGTVVAAQ